MAKITTTDGIQVSITLDGVDQSVSLEPGDHDVLDPIADLLLNQGLATITSKSSSKKTSAPAPVSENPTIPSTSEA
jgi:hypothetical protein